MLAATRIDLPPTAAKNPLSRNARTSDPRVRRARNSVLIGLIVFAALIATVHAKFDGPQRDPVYYLRWSRLIQQIHASPVKPYTVVMLGTSRTFNGFRPTSLKVPLTRALNRPVVAGNFGLPGCCASMHLLTWNRLLRDGARPDLVLIEVMPAQLMVGWSPVELAAERLPLCRLRLCDLPILSKYFSDIRPGISHDWWLAQPAALYDYRLAMLSKIAPNLLPSEHVVALEKETVLPEDLPPTPLVITAEGHEWNMKHSRGQYAAGLQNFHVGGRCCAEFRELLVQVQRDGAKAVLVVMPEGPEFRSWYKPGDFQQIYDFLGKLRAEFGVAVVDAHEWMAEADFYDSHHLTQDGAAKFTTRLGEECLVPLLQGRSDSPVLHGPQASAR